jgi:hypothetical protein
MNETKSRGRPKGSRNGTPMLQPWKPLKWLPVYETMVALHISGLSHVTIGERLDYSATQVGNIIRSPEAVKIAEDYRKNIRSLSSETIPAQLEDLATTAVGRIKSMIENDELNDAAPFRMADFSMKFLQGIGTLSDGSSKTESTTNIVQIAPELAAGLIAGLAKAAEAKRLNAGNSIIIGNTATDAS